MGTATLIKHLEVERSGIEQALYRVSPPIDGHELVVVSASTIMGRPKTYIFAADDQGEITNWAELTGSVKDTLRHSDALDGYKITKA